MIRAMEVLAGKSPGVVGFQELRLAGLKILGVLLTVWGWAIA
jgi:hypothetical protein